MRKTPPSAFALGLALSALTAAAAANGFATTVSGDVEATINGPGNLTCRSMGDLGPGYLDLRNGHATDKISFSLPLQVEAGTYEITSWTKLAAARSVGKGYSIEISMPLKRFHKAIGASGTLTLTEAGKQPGERVTGSFDVTSDSMGTEIRLEGTFDFEVPENARAEC
jgi:hypothetical protein